MDTLESFYQCCTCNEFDKPVKACICGRRACNICWRNNKKCLCGKAVTFNKLVKDDARQERAQALLQLTVLSEKYQQAVFTDKSMQKHDANLVNEWLSNSQNHFSAPITETQNSFAKKGDAKSQKNEKSSDRCLPQIPLNAINNQEGWETIEVLHDPEPQKENNKENMFGPLDIEDFLDDEAYSFENPRRSSRNKNHSLKKTSVEKINPPDIQTIEAQIEHLDDKQTTATESKMTSEKVSTWSNVNKMKKDLKKLNKRNIKKLNISTEVCENVPFNSNKNELTQAVTLIDTPINIDDSTPIFLDTGIEKNNMKNLDANKQTFVNRNTSIEKSYRNHKFAIEAENSDSNTSCTNILKEKCGANGKQPVVVLSDINAKKISRLLSQNTENVGVIMNQTSEKTEKIRRKRSSIFIENGSNEYDINTDKNKRQRYETETNRNYALTKQVNEQAKGKKLVPFIKKSRMVSEGTNQSVTYGYSKGNEPIYFRIQYGNITVVINENFQNNNSKSFNVSTNAQTQTENELCLSCLTKNISASKSTHYVVNQKSTNTRSNKIDRTRFTINDIKIGLDRNQSSLSSKKQTASLETASANYPVTVSEENELATKIICEEDFIATNSPISKQCEQVSDLERTSSEIIATRPIRKTCQYRMNVENTQKHNIKQTHDSPSLADEKKIDITFKSYPTSIEKQAQDTQECMEKEFGLGQFLNPFSASLPMKQNEKVLQIRNNKSDDMKYSKNYETLMNPTHVTVLTQSACNSLPTTVSLEKPQINEHKIQDSEAIFSLCENTLKSQKTAKIHPKAMTQDQIEELLTPRICEDFDEQAMHEEGGDTDKALVTPGHRKKRKNTEDSESSVVEDTPQKHLKHSRESHSSVKGNSSQELHENSKGSQLTESVIHLTDATLVQDAIAQKEPSISELVTSKYSRKTVDNFDTSSQFIDAVQYKSTPKRNAMKSLNFYNNNSQESQVNSNEAAQPTSLENEIMNKAFEKTLSQSNVTKKPYQEKLVIGCSCLTNLQDRNVRELCARKGWTYAAKFFNELTHLVVNVDEENKAQRSVKFACAVGAGKWVVSYEWAARCLATDSKAHEEEFEALDSFGAPGPRLSRLASKRVLADFTFYCQPPFQTIEKSVLEEIIMCAGGRVAGSAREVRVVGGGGRACAGAAFVLLEADVDQDETDLFDIGSALAMREGVVSLNVDWAVHSVCSGELELLAEYSLAPMPLLRRALPPHLHRLLPPAPPSDH